jgi:hypothetical protein
MIHGWEDWEFWISLSTLNRRIVKLPEPLFLYRVRSSSRDHSLRFFRKLAMFRLMVWRHRGLYLRNSGYVLKKLADHILSGMSGRRT